MGSLDCPKCDKPYVRAGVRREKHVKECNGPKGSGIKKMRTNRRSVPLPAPVKTTEPFSELLKAALAKLDEKEKELKMKLRIVEAHRGKLKAIGEAGDITLPDV